MKTFITNHGRALALACVLLPLLGLLVFVARRSGPLAPVPVTVATVEIRALTPALFGIGSVEARYTHKIGATVAGRIKRVDVQTGDHVKAGQLLGEMDPVDFDDKIGAQDASFKRAEAGAAAAEAQKQEVGIRKKFAEAQADRYEQLLTSGSVSAESTEAKRQELQSAQAALSAAAANLNAARHDVTRLRAERDGLNRQRVNLRLISPVDGIITRREADPGTTVIAGQSVIEVVGPDTIWVSVRFDQQRASGLRAQLPAQIVLRSLAGEPLAGIVARIEPHADVVTEEILAKVEFRQRQSTMPPIGELAEITVALPSLKPLPLVQNASVQRIDGRLGVWIVEGDNLRFTPVTTGATDLEGRVQILAGLKGGERVVVYSKKELNAHSRIKIMERIAGKKP
jgi:RND family efflux transporter MFP subunit